MFDSAVWAAVSGTAMTDFESASGLSGSGLLNLIEPLTQVVLWVGVLWIVVAAVRAWMAGRSDALETVMILLRSTLVLVALVTVMAVLGSS